MFTPFLLVGLLVEHNGLASGTVQKNHVIRGIPDAEVQAGIPSLCRKGFFLLAGQPFGPGIHVSVAHTVLTSSFQRFNSEGCMVMIL